MTNWSELARYDSQDEMKHMGMLVLSSKNSKIKEKMKNIGYNTLKRDGKLQIEGLFINMEDKMQFGFIHPKICIKDD